ncbi:MAG: hypothetical protein WC761_02770 [Candidatus Paceibacterota bacterium]|jgi:hypothetical protein
MKLLAFFEKWSSLQQEFVVRDQPIVVKDLTEKHIVVRTLAAEANVSRQTVLELLQTANITTVND